MNNIHKILFIILFNITFLISTMAESINTIGMTYPIVEKNILVSIKERAAKINLLQEYKNNQDFSSKVRLTRVLKDEDRLREVSPDYELPFEVRIPNKGVLYPKNYKFNPLKHFNLPSSIVIVADEQDYQLIKDHSLIKENPMYISLTNPLDMNKNRTDSEHFFMLTKKMAERLKIEKVPSIINQVKDKLVINEVFLDRDKN